MSQSDDVLRILREAENVIIDAQEGNLVSFCFYGNDFTKEEVAALATVMDDWAGQLSKEITLKVFDE